MTRELMNFSEVVNDICFKMVKAGHYANVPYLRICDMDMVFFINLRPDRNEIAIINNDATKAWGVTVNELYAVARLNTPRLFPVNREYMDKIVPVVDVVSLCVSANIYIATNKYMLNGFSVIMYPNYLDDIAKEFGKFFILPSSKHEALIIPTEICDDPETLYQMVYAINRSSVREEDRLTDNVYWYDADERKLRSYR